MPDPLPDRERLLADADSLVRRLRTSITEARIHISESRRVIEQSRKTASAAAAAIARIRGVAAPSTAAGDATRVAPPAAPTDVRREPG